ncbi:hypothetical protein [Microterricola viridarii]|uniref:hypothetical protein n=1 Tax=Microterricola viridarii TaxID=412690 RepID=UPI0018D3DE47|nr:hypothetical protein [Microterricola viridarii]
MANRAFGEVYQVSGKRDIHQFLIDAVEASGARVLYASQHVRAPIYLGVQLDSDERIGLLIYAFRVKGRATNNRPADEVRGQLRYGSEENWDRTHTLSKDVAGVDLTLVVGVDLEDQIIIGLDPLLWDPLPMGISFYAKRPDIEKAQASGWHVWEKSNRGGNKRPESRSPSSLETIVALRPNRFMDYTRLERRASALRLEPALRHSLAVSMTEAVSSTQASPRHVLEERFDLTGEQILDIIGGRSRLTVAVRGGVAEHHLEAFLAKHPSVAHVERLDLDAQHDFNVELISGEVLRVECKNASPEVYKDSDLEHGYYSRGDGKVEVQKTRASKDDPASRFYAVDAFDMVAACTFSSTGRWEFRFGRTSSMRRHKDFPDRLSPIQAINSSWAHDV